MAESPSITNRKGKFSAFTDEQKATLMKYFDNYGMTSTHRRNTELMTRCAAETNTTISKVKNWIGSEVVKRKRKAGILPLPKFEFAAGSPELKPLATPPAKKIRRVNGYNLFFSDYVQNHSNLGPDFKERNTVVAQRWAELSEEERKQWGAKAEVVCSSSIQDFNQQQLQDQSSILTLPTTAVMTDDNIVEKILLQMQEKFELLEQLGFEGYAIFVNTGALQTHLLATGKGKAYHKQRQQLGKPLENPFIGYVFSDSNPEITPPTGVSPSSSNTTVTTTGLHTSSSPLKLLKPPSLPPTVVSSPGGNHSSMSLETMQRSVASAFALKHKISTGSSEIPYNSLEETGVQVYGLPNSIPFHSPYLYNQQQLQQILANLDKIVFLKIPEGEIPEVEIEPESVASLVHDHALHLSPNPSDT